MQVHLIDGTYELFRHHFAMPSHKTEAGNEVAAVRGVLRSVLLMIADGATHLGVATDHVIESFRNDLWPGYKSSAGVPSELLSQFPLLEEALTTMGVTVWPMIEYEADDALATAAAQAAGYAEQVLICTPDKDLGQCVAGTRVLQLDRPARRVLDEDAIVAKFGVVPPSIPDYLALVGDSADGFPGLPGWGPQSAAAVLSRYGHIEAIPTHALRWEAPVRGALALATTLAEHRDLAMLFKDLAKLRTSLPIDASQDQLLWRGPRSDFRATAEYLGTPVLADQAVALAAAIHA